MEKKNEYGSDVIVDSLKAFEVEYAALNRPCQSHMAFHHESQGEMEQRKIPSHEEKTIASSAAGRFDKPGTSMLSAHSILGKEV